jgi:hypothetical protein
MITRRLLDFIQRARAKGTSHEDVSVTLKAHGWTSADIDIALHTLDESDPGGVPRPVKGELGAFCEMLTIMWRVYCARWKRFAMVGVIYTIVVISVSFALFMFALPAMPTFMGLVSLGNISGAFSLAFPYLILATIAYIVIQLWYVGVLYRVALKRGESLLDQCLAGIEHLPSILGIKISITLLLLISFVPVIATTFFTQNPLVFVLFAPVSVIAAVFLYFLFSLAIPAYFHGISWQDATLKSMKTVFRHKTTAVVAYVFFGITLVFFSMLFKHTGPIAVAVAVVLISPMEVLFLIALYRRLAPPDVIAPRLVTPPRIDPVALPVTSDTPVVVKVEEATAPAPRPAKRPRRRTRTTPA